MFQVAQTGFLINPTKKISNNYPEIESFDNYKDLERGLLSNSLFQE